MRKRLIAILILPILLATAASAREPLDRQPVLRFSAGEFRPNDTRAAAPDWFSASPVDRSPSGRRFVVAITRGPLDLEQRRRMESAGSEILDYVPDNGYRLRLIPGAEAALRAMPFVAWVGSIPSLYKIEPGLAALAGKPEPITRIRVVLAAGESQSRVLSVLDGLPVTAQPSGKEKAWRVEATIPADRLASNLSALSVLPEVEGVEQVRRLEYLNQDAVWVHQSFVGPSSQETPIFDRGIFGCDQVVAVADSGQDFDMCYFLDTLNGPPPISSCLAAPCPAAPVDPSQRKDIIYYNWSGTPDGDDDTCPASSAGSGHGTHTSGSIAGDAPDYADCAGFTTAGRTVGDGQAPGAKLIVQELGDRLEYLVSGGGTVWNLADVAFASGARVQSFSWGGGCYNSWFNCVPGCELTYDSLARDADLAMWSYPDLLLVLSAGNAGGICNPPNSISTPALAKSPITTGALRHGSDADTVSNTSSRGPVFDGRLKPTLMAQGEATVSAASDANPNTENCDTCSLGGTSMAAPTVAGLAALAREYYTAGFYTAGERNEALGFEPSGALLKATLIDSAKILTPWPNQPDFQTGYGRVQLDSTLAFGDSGFRLDVDDHREGITTGSVVERAYDVTAGTPFTATLVWTDFPAALNSAAARVNELQLEVTDPNGDTWFQTLHEILDAPTATMDPADLHDPVNVEERLAFDTPAEGRWVVRIRGINVPWNAQPFALVVRGNMADCPAPESPEVPTLSSPADGQVLVSWNPVSGAAAYDLYRSHGDCAEGAWVPIATAVTGLSFLDDTVSGGTPYSYRVTAASDVDAHCESAPSPCASIVADGECVLAPVFQGITDAGSLGANDCSIELTWNEATPFCGTDVRYNLYRDTTAGFLPGPSNLVARCVVGTAYSDAVDLTYGQTYHYVVRAEDATTGHGGPCGGGNEDLNLAEADARPDGPLVVGTWQDDAGDTGEAKFTAYAPWTVAETGGTPGGPNVYSTVDNSGSCANLYSPVLILSDPGSAPSISFATIHDFQFVPGGMFGDEGSLGEIQIARGPDFDNWTRVELSPDYPTTVETLSGNCSPVTPPDTYFSGFSPVYSTYTASLANWGGSEVVVRFHSVSDLITPRANWSIDDVEVTQALVPGSCDSLAAGPPPVPDGASVPGEPLFVTKSGSDVLLTWDAARCPAAAVNVYRGAIGDYSTFTAGDCDLPADGSALLSVPNNAWFLVVATDGVSVDGSWSRDGTGKELDYSGSGAVCPEVSGHATNNNSCP